MIARVLIVAGSDSGGGAGIQADIKTVTCLGGYAATAITALTAQNTLGVHGVVAIEPAFVAQQMRVVLQDIGADCIKTGMLFDAQIIAAVGAVLDDWPHIPLVVDPVMVAQSGDRLLSDNALSAMQQLLLPRATLITPNLPEAETLLGRKIMHLADQQPAAQELLALTGAGAVLLKGGHAEGDQIHDVFANAEQQKLLTGKRIHTRNNHGTGCTLAAAIATGIAAGLDTLSAIEQARQYLRTALATATDLGQGHGPVNHGHTVQQQSARKR
jgi:hydroxymethylpyrimidine/phosphomethylpyrimidine kinase